MKIRNGFVSNSSSSSFVVCFDKEIKTVEDLISYCKDGIDKYSRVEESDKDALITKETFANYVFPYFYRVETDEEIISALKSGKYYEEDRLSLVDVVSAKYGLLRLQKTNREYRNAERIEIVECLNTLVHSKSKFWYVFELEDHGVLGSIEYLCESFFVNEKDFARRISHH